MNFEQAERFYNELRARIERGEAISRTEYEQRVRQWSVTDDKEMWWEIYPHTGTWMYFDGSRWVEGIPPGHKTSSAIRPAEGSAQPSMPAAPATPFPRTTSGTSTGTPTRQPWQRIPRGEGDQRWIFFAVGAVALLFCAIAVFVGGNVVLSVFDTPPTPTRVVAQVPTPTRVPTVVPSPTQPPPTPTPTIVLARIIEARVNVRAAPSLEGRIIGKVTRGTEITLIGKSEDGAWYRVTLADIPEPSWIFGETMEIGSGDPNLLPVVK